MKRLNNLFKLLRVKHWVKNAFIFFPLIFSGHLFQQQMFISVLLTFMGFCLTASGLYILNDYLDRDRDAIHPRKSKRILAQQPISLGALIFLISMLLGAGLTICWQTDPAVFYVVLVYVLIHTAYNMGIKNIVLLDVIFVALGFHIRIWAGALACGVLPSEWLQMCVFLLALFLGFTKRRTEITTLKDKAADHRMVLAHYTPQLLDQIILICSTLAITFYGLYTISTDIITRLGNQHMAYSITFVIYGMFRYLYLIHIKDLGDDPGEALLSDYPLLINIILWVLFISLILYPLPFKF